MGPKKKGDADNGEKVFEKLCSACHAFGSHGIGPNLQGVSGRPTASAEGFAYS